jgi:hypothetical protein
MPRRSRAPFLAGLEELIVGPDLYHLGRLMMRLEAEPVADLTRKFEGRVSMSAVEERLIELRENADPK